jgi:hypothetical protein
MTPDTAKIKCKNFLATLLRLASDQPEAIARNVRSLTLSLPSSDYYTSPPSLRAEISHLHLPPLLVLFT